MSGFKELIDANASFRESLKEQEDILQAACYLNVEEVLERKLNLLKLLEAKKYLLGANVAKGATEVTTFVGTPGNILERLGETTEKAVAERSLMKFIATSNTVKQLFSVPESELTSDRIVSKHQCRKLMVELSDEEMKLTALQEKTEKCETRRNEVLELWHETLSKLQEKASGIKDNENRSDDHNMLPGKKKLQDVISKMDAIKCLISKLITAKQYDWITDHRNIKPLLMLTRENFTTEMFDE